MNTIGSSLNNQNINSINQAVPDLQHIQKTVLSFIDAVNTGRFDQLDDLFSPAYQGSHAARLIVNFDYNEMKEYLEDGRLKNLKLGDIKQKNGMIECIIEFNWYSKNKVDSGRFKSGVFITFDDKGRLLRTISGQPRLVEKQGAKMQNPTI